MSMTTPNVALFITIGFCRVNFSFDIPFSLIQLCYRFYVQDIHNCCIVWFGGNVDTLNTKQSIEFIDVETKTKVSIKYNDDDKYHSGFGIISASNFKMPPYIKQCIMEKYDTDKFEISPFMNNKILFNCGGSYRSNHEFSAKCNAIIAQFNSNNDLENHYFAQLPDLPHPMAHCNIASQFINWKCCNIYCIGGAPGCGQLKRSDKIYGMDLTLKTNPKWTSKASLNHPKCGMSTCIINQQKLFIFGGICEFWDEIEIFDLTDDNMENMLTRIKCKTKMKYGRYKSGCCELPHYNKIIIGGGLSKQSKAIKHIELIDINTEKIKVLKATLKHDHKYNPVLWIDCNNPNIVYIGGEFIANKCCFVGGDLLGEIEWIDLREKKTKWNTLSESMTEFCALSDNKKWIQSILI